jgi:hypothetical protein
MDNVQNNSQALLLLVILQKTDKVTSFASSERVSLIHELSLAKVLTFHVKNTGLIFFWPKGN